MTQIKNATVNPAGSLLLYPFSISVIRINLWLTSLQVLPLTVETLSHWPTDSL